MIELFSRSFLTHLSLGGEDFWFSLEQQMVENLGKHVDGKAFMNRWFSIDKS